MTRLGKPISHSYESKIHIKRSGNLMVINSYAPTAVRTNRLVAWVYSLMFVLDHSEINVNYGVGGN